MDLYLFVPMLLIAVVQKTRGTPGQCSTSQGTAIKFSIVGHQNTTGHWIIKVNAARDDPWKKGKRWIPKTFGIDVEQKAQSCGLQESTLLSAVAVASGSVGSCPGVRYEFVKGIGHTAVDICPPTDYEFYEGYGYYKVHTTALVWKEARDKCAMEGSHLMVINSDSEAELFKIFFSRNRDIKNATNVNYAHLGFHDLSMEGLYETVQGTPLSSSGYEKWASGEPSKGPEENCGCVNEAALLYDVRCNWRCFFICEF